MIQYNKYLANLTNFLNSGSKGETKFQKFVKTHDSIQRLANLMNFKNSGSEEETEEVSAMFPLRIPN